MYNVESKTTFDLKKIIDNKSIAFLSLGSIEQHGPFLPMNTDVLISEFFLKKLASKIEKGGYKSFTYPTIKFTPTLSAANFKGNINVNNNNFRNYLADILQSITDDGYMSVVLINSHGTNEALVNEVIFNSVNRQFKSNNSKVIPMLLINTYQFNEEIGKKFNQQPGKHADWVEFLILYRILGSKYFTYKLINKIKRLDEKKNNEQIDILGAPIELRSKKGTIGELLPTNMDLGIISKKLCQFIENKSLDLLNDFLINIENLNL